MTHFDKNVSKYLQMFTGVFLFLFLFCINPPQAFSGTVFSTNRLVEQIKRVKASIVAIGTYFVKDTPKARFWGTAFAVGDGSIVVTNCHTIVYIEKEKKINQLRIFHPKFQENGKKVSLLVKDETHDLVLLKIESGSLSPLNLVDSENVNEGEAVAFTGYPLGFVLGLNPTTHAGIVSAIAPIILPSPKGRAIKKEMVEFLRQPYDIFQIDATAYPGNSGSPVYRISTGEVIGIVNMVFVKGRKESLIKDPSGITYAIPANFARFLIKDLNS
jgi:serine protease Do